MKEKAGKKKETKNVDYMEVGVGVENIFKFLRLDYVWRLTYRDHPDIQTKGVRFSMHLTF